MVQDFSDRRTEKKAAPAHALTTDQVSRLLHEQQRSDAQAQPLLQKITPLTDAEQRQPFKSAQAEPVHGLERHAVVPGRPVAPQSILDFAVHKALDPVVSTFTSNQAYKDAAAQNVKDFIKTVPLFMTGRIAGASTLISYASDEVKTSDRGMDLVTDAALGLAKGGTLRASQSFLMSRNVTPSLMGVELGIVNRASSVGFSKENYYNRDGQFDLAHGLGKTALASVESIGTDALIYGAADSVWGRAFLRSRGEAAYNPVITTAITAGGFNMTTTAGAEVTRQIESGKFDASSLASRSFTAGLTGLGAGALAGLQRRSFLALKVKDGPNALSEARSTPYQLGHIADEAQMFLRDGNFIPQQKVVGPTGTAWVGKVEHAGGQKDAIFRVNDGSEGFAHRQQSEIAGYGLNKEIGFKNPFPTTVARTAEIGGEKMSGFIQEMRGSDLVTHFSSLGVESKGLQLDRTQLINRLNADPGLKSSLTESWGERMVLGEWDNHAKNQIVARTAHGDQASNIDIGDGLRPAKTELDLAPSPGLRRSYENANSYIYKELRRTPLDPELVDKLQSFAERNSSPEGRQKIEALGLTPQQAEGVLGRSQWFATNKVLPPASEMPGYVAVSKVLKPMRDGLRWAKRSLKAALDR